MRIRFVRGVASHRHAVSGDRYVFSVLAVPVAQTCSLSVSVEIVASCDDFLERGCVRSTSRSASEPREIPVSLQPFVPFLPAAAGPADTAALLWLRLRRAALYRRFLTCPSPPASNVLAITNRRLARSLPLARSSGPLPRFAGQSPFAASQAAQVGRLRICATVNRYGDPAYNDVGRVPSRGGVYGAILLSLPGSPPCTRSGNLKVSLRGPQVAQSVADLCCLLVIFAPDGFVQGVFKLFPLGEGALGVDFLQPRLQ